MIERPNGRRTISLAEEMGLTYHMENGVMIPDLKLAEQKDIGKYGRMRLDFMKEKRKELLLELQATGELNPYLVKINEEASEKIMELTENMMKKNNITETLKAENQMQWVQEYNSFRMMAEEMVREELIYS